MDGCCFEVAQSVARPACGRVLVAALKYEATLQSMARLLVPRLADFCLVAMREKFDCIFY